ncbi:hypothetical protein D3C87_1630830 [compost metagenome]
MRQQSEGTLRAGFGGIVWGRAAWGALVQHQIQRGQFAGGRAEGDFQPALMQRVGIRHVAGGHQCAERQGQKRQPQHAPGAHGASEAEEAGEFGHSGILVEARRGPARPAARPSTAWHGKTWRTARPSAMRGPALSMARRGTGHAKILVPFLLAGWLSRLPTGLLALAIV